MNADQEYELNERAYRRLKDHIDRTYPTGHYVALLAGEIAADAPTFEDLQAKLDRIEPDPQRGFVIQAGVEYPVYEVIRPSRAP
jgi:hypothetical protein